MEWRETAHGASRTTVGVWAEAQARPLPRAELAGGGEETRGETAGVRLGSGVGVRHPEVGGWVPATAMTTETKGGRTGDGV